MSTPQATDELLIQRGTSVHKITFADLLAAAGGGLPISTNSDANVPQFPCLWIRENNSLVVIRETP